MYEDFIGGAGLVVVRGEGRGHGGAAHGVDGESVVAEEDVAVAAATLEEALVATVALLVVELP